MSGYCMPSKFINIMIRSHNNRWPIFDVGEKCSGGPVMKEREFSLPTRGPRSLVLGAANPNVFEFAFLVKIKSVGRLFGRGTLSFTTVFF
jgi:hypothetical protein